jgi:hypothetical protein
MEVGVGSNQTLGFFDLLVLYFPWLMLAVPPLVCLVLAILGFLEEPEGNDEESE